MAVSRHSIRTVAERRKMRMGVMATLYVLIAVAFAVKQGVDTFGVKGIFNLLIYENLPRIASSVLLTVINECSQNICNGAYEIGS